MIFEELFVMNIGEIQIYLLWFLLGSFTVATISDLKHMSAQKEFVDFWLGFGILMFLLDLYYNFYLSQNLVFLVFKWGLIFMAIPIIFHFKGVARGDITAKIAATSLFPPVWIVLFIFLVEIVRLFTARFWKVFGNERAYPFMPVIYITTIIILLINLPIKFFI